MLAVVLALALQQDNPKAAYDFLRRHQNEDGSWGRVPESCRCPIDLAEPRDLVVSTEVKQRVQALVDDLASDDIDTRSRAVDTLAETGDAAIASLKRLASSDHAGHRDRAEVVLRQIARARQAPDFELTCWTMLAFNDAGWSHLCKEPEGAMLRKALAYLTNRQGIDGGFDGPLSTSLLGALTLMRSYGLTGSKLLADPARRAYAYVKSQHPEKTADLIAMALCRLEAIADELEARDASIDAHLRELDRRDGALATAGRALLDAIRRNGSDDRGRELSRLDPTTWGPMTTGFATWAIYAGDNVYWARRSVFTAGDGKDRTPNWTAWCAKLKKAAPVVMEPGCRHGAMGRGDVRDQLVWTAHLAYFYGHNKELR